MANNNFKPFGISNGANVTSQADYEALAALLTGFTAGKASSAQINKALRQGTVMSSVLAQFISDTLGVDVLDNGVTSTILANLKAALLSAGTGRLLGAPKIITTNQTYAPSAGTKYCLVEVQGGGGGGGGSGSTSSSAVSIGAGGGAGGYAKGFYPVSSLTGLMMTIGAGGSGGNLGPSNGISGGQTSFGSLIVCAGGTGGIGTNSTPPYSCFPGGGGSATGGNIINMAGDPGVAGSAAALNNFIAGKGGIGPLGTGGLGRTTTGTGSPGSGYGSGGSGSATGYGTSAPTPNTNGGAGAPGVIIIWEYA